MGSPGRLRIRRCVQSHVGRRDNDKTSCLICTTTRRVTRNLQQAVSLDLLVIYVGFPRPVYTALRVTWLDGWADAGIIADGQPIPVRESRIGQDELVEQRDVEEDHPRFVEGLLGAPGPDPVTVALPPKDSPRSAKRVLTSDCSSLMLYSNLPSNCSS